MIYDITCLTNLVPEDTRESTAVAYQKIYFQVSAINDNNARELGKQKFLEENNDLELIWLIIKPTKKT